jgi:hypothetical protein
MCFLSLRAMGHITALVHQHLHFKQILLKWGGGLTRGVGVLPDKACSMWAAMLSTSSIARAGKCPATRHRDRTSRSDFHVLGPSKKRYRNTDWWCSAPASVSMGIILTVSTKTPGIIMEYISVPKTWYYLTRTKNILTQNELKQNELNMLHLMAKFQTRF